MTDFEQLLSDFAALGQPVRLRLMFYAREVEAFSPKRASEDLGIQLENLAYHVRVLADAGMIELVGRQARRGALMHVYCLTEHGAAVLQLNAPVHD